MKNLLLIFLLIITFSIITSAQSQQGLSKRAQILVNNFEKYERLPPKENEILVVGAVVEPQTINVKEGITLSQVIEKVGGIKYGASQDILVIRKSSDSKYTSDFMVNLQLVKSGKEKDPILQNGDIVVVSGKIRHLFPQEPAPPRKIPSKYV